MATHRPILRWNLSKYTLLNSETPEFSQTQFSSSQRNSGNRMVVQSRTPGDLQFQLGVSTRACKLIYERNVLEEIMLEGPGVPTVLRKGCDVVFKSMLHNFEQRKFRVKFSPSGGITATDQCSDCLSYLRQYAKINEADSANSSEKSDFSSSVSLSQSSAGLSQDLFGSFSQSASLLSQGSSDDFSQPVPLMLNDVGRRTTSFSQPIGDESIDSTVTEYPRGFRQSSPKRRRVDSWERYSNDLFSRFQPPMKREKQGSGRSSSLSQPLSMGAERAFYPFSQISGILETTLPTTDDSQPLPVFRKDVSTETTIELPKKDTESQTDEAEVVGKEDNAGKAVDRELVDLMDQVVKSENFLEIAGRMGRILDGNENRDIARTSIKRTKDVETQTENIEEKLMKMCDKRLTGLLRQVLTDENFKEFANKMAKILEGLKNVNE